MIFRLRTIEHTADGREIVRDRDLETQALGIGRSAENAIHLPDLALEPFHATIRAVADGRVGVEALGPLGFDMDGRTLRQAEIDPQSGVELRFGSYRLLVARDDDGAWLVVIRQVKGDGQPADGKAGFSVAGLLPGKRAMSWALAIGVLVAFLAVPVIGNLMRDRTAVTSLATSDAVAGDRAWSSGPLSLAHHGLENNCTACHVRPFEAVRDETCQTCHKAVHGHAEADRLANARGDMALGSRLLWGVAHTFGKPGPGACSDCHNEHEGAGRMEPARQQFCADCHGTLDQHLPDTRIGNAGDFGRLHPEFRPAIPLAIGSRILTRVTLARHPREASGLIFPHRLHLLPDGGVARMAASLARDKGYGAGGLGCQDCHRKTADGVRFAPIEMERDCGSCHSLAYDEVGGIVRKLRHGDVNQMIADLSATRIGANPIITGRRRPGEFASGGTYHADFRGPASSAPYAVRALSRDGICGECHLPDFSRGRFGVMPVTQVTRYMAHGWFNHGAHKQEKCTSCHAADKSATSADLLLPDLKSCRTCHLGESARKAAVPSSCAMCHSYHLTTDALRSIPGGKP